MCDWPRSLADWDILFLLPLPWWGPVWAPVSIALLMIVWGTMASRFERCEEPLVARWKSGAMNMLGVALALYVFMADSIRVAKGGVEALRKLLPTQFNWPLFTLALLLIAAPVMENFLWLWRKRISAVGTPMGNARLPESL
jgi:hypothetical protein